MSNPVLRFSAAVALVIAAPAAASAQSVAYSTKSPVAITSFAVNEGIAPAGNIEEPPEIITSGITVKFVNTNSVPVAGVTFLVNDGNYRQTFVDRGTFSPGVQIRHNFAVEGSPELSNAQCSVAEVDFADGTVWHPAPGPVAQR